MGRCAKDLLFRGLCFAGEDMKCWRRGGCDVGEELRGEDLEGEILGKSSGGGF